MTEIYLIRHTQAEGNLYRMMQGHWDGDVTPDGRLQIAALSKRFEKVHVDAVYSSDLYRAMETAGAITGPHRLPLHTDPDLREINLGPWEALFFANVFRDEPESAELFLFDPDHWVREGAETFGQVTERAYAALERIARRHEGQTVAVVSHGVTIRCLLAKITGTPLNETKRLPIGGNTAVSRLLWDGERFTAAYLNDASHLEGLPFPAWSGGADLRHESFDPATDRAYYENCYAEAWRAAHGSLAGFAPGPYYASALEHYRAYPGAVLKMYDGEEAVGLVDLDTGRGAHAGYGWVSLLYLREDHRGRGLGVQLLARAIQTYRSLGRKSLRLHVSEDNKAALAFYRHWGFEQLGEETGGGVKLLLMERTLEGKRHV